MDSRNDEHETTLHNACAQGKENIVRMLLGNTVDANTVKKCYETFNHNCFRPLKCSFQIQSKTHQNKENDLLISTEMSLALE